MSQRKTSSLSLIHRSAGSNGVARWVLLASLLVTLAAPPAVFGQSGRLDRRQYKSGESMLHVFRPAVAEVAKATVRIKSDGKDAALGVIVDPNGWILTKASEVKGEITVHLSDGRSFEAQLLHHYSRADVAMLKIEAADLPVAQWADEPVVLGQWAVTAGAGIDPVAIGIVSVKERRVPEPAVLGIMLNRDDDAARVRTVFADSGAAKAGLKPNDIITMIADRPVRNGDELINFIQDFRPGDAVRVNLLRGEEVVEVEVVLSAPPTRRNNRSAFQNQLGGELSERNYGFEQAFQHDTVLKPSDCGGPLVNIDGKVVGLNIARSGRTESYALPVPLVKRLIAEFKAGQHAVVPAAPPATELTASKGDGEGN